MKGWGLFFAGVFTGIIVMGFIDILKMSSNKETNDTEIVSKEDDGITLFEEPGDIVEVKSFKVFQVLAKDAALVQGETKYSGVYSGIVYLLMNKEGKLYYDDEIVNVPKGSIVRQMGIYQYPTKDDMIKTVPIIRIMEK
jgi:hypothetical protein